MVNIIARRNLVSFWTAHPEAERSLRAWMSAADKLGWRSMNDVVGTFSKASPINAERCAFNIHGNNYRLIAAFRFDVNLCFIKFIGSHADYDRIDAATVEQF